ncbi:MAG: hypothetical protein WB992_00385 [Bryobacteraceae bacterium]
MPAPLIQPEDKQPDEQVTVRLRPEVARELRAYGQYASDSSASHVVSSALRRLFAADKGFQSYKQDHPSAGDLTGRSNGRSRRKPEAKA